MDNFSTESTKFFDARDADASLGPDFDDHEMMSEVPTNNHGVSLHEEQAPLVVVAAACKKQVDVNPPALTHVVADAEQASSFTLFRKQWNMKLPESKLRCQKSAAVCVAGVSMPVRPSKRRNDRNCGLSS